MGLFLAVGAPALIACALFLLHRGAIDELAGALVVEALMVVGDLVALIGAAGAILLLTAPLLVAKLRRLR